MTPDPGQALYYSSNGDIFSGKLSSKNIFDPANQEDVDLVVSQEMKTRKGSSTLFLDGSESQNGIAEKIREHLRDGGTDQQLGGGNVEMYAVQIKQAGFDGYVAWESGVPAVGIFPDKLNLADFRLDKDANKLNSDFEPYESGPPGQFMPGYNPRYTDENGDFDREAWLDDRRRAEQLLRRRGVYRSSVTEEEWEQLIRDAMREVRRQSW